MDTLRELRNFRKKCKDKSKLCNNPHFLFNSHIFTSQSNLFKFQKVKSYALLNQQDLIYYISNLQEDLIDYHRSYFTTITNKYQVKFLFPKSPKLQDDMLGQTPP